MTSGPCVVMLLEREDAPVSHTCWAAEESGLTIPLFLTLEP